MKRARHEENEDKNNPTQTDSWYLVRLKSLKKTFLQLDHRKEAGLEAYHFNGRYYEFDDNRMILKTYFAR